MTAAENETTVHMEFDFGRWYAFRLQVTDTRIQAWIDEEQCIDVDLQKHWVEVRAGEIETISPLRLRHLRDDGGPAQDRVPSAGAGRYPVIPMSDFQVTSRRV